MTNLSEQNTGAANLTSFSVINAPLSRMEISYELKSRLVQVLKEKCDPYPLLLWPPEVPPCLCTAD